MRMNCLCFSIGTTRLRASFLCSCNRIPSGIRRDGGHNHFWLRCSFARPSIITYVDGYSLYWVYAATYTLPSSGCLEKPNTPRTSRPLTSPPSNRPTKLDIKTFLHAVSTKYKNLSISNCLYVYSSVDNFKTNAENKFTCNMILGLSGLFHL